MTEIVHKELSYQIVKMMIAVFKELGSGKKEIVYERALAKAFDLNGIKYQRQVYSAIEFQKEKVGCYYFDFLIEGVVILEIKQKDHLVCADYEQIKRYLKHSGLQLGILATFRHDGVEYKRVLNLY